MSRIAIGRIVGLFFAIFALGLSAWCTRDAMLRNAEFRRWLVARPMATVIDLSRSGETSVPFHQTCGIAHGEALYFESDLDSQSEREVEALFRGLVGNIVIRDAEGREIDSVSLDGTIVQSWGSQILLARLARFPRGDYIASIRVESGAAALADRRQTIHARYQLCGLEQMPAIVAGAFAMVTGVFGLVAVVGVLPGLRKHGLWRPTASSKP